MRVHVYDELFFLHAWSLFAPISGVISKKATSAFGNCQRQVFSLVVFQHMHKIKHLWKFEFMINWSSVFFSEIIMQGKNSCHTKLFAVRCLNSRPQNQVLRFPNQIHKLKWEITSFSKLTLLQRERFLTMLCIINNSPLIVTK